MERREFLKASCYTSLASLAAGASIAFGQPDPPRLAGESAAAYQARLARLRALEAARSRSLAAGSGSPPTVAEGPLPFQLPNETDAAYQARVARLRALQAARAAERRQFYELRRYTIETQAQRAGFDAFAAEALVPALNRAYVGPVGVFYPAEGLSPIYVLLCHRSANYFAGLTAALMQDEEFLALGATFLEAPASKPAYQRMEVQLMLAFEGMPKLETPVDSPERVFQLRTYESPSVQTGLKKIEMFNQAEIEIFRKTGLNPVFFGQTLAGAKMPNLTYMLGFNGMDECKANWSGFSRDPDWQTLRAMPEYDDKKILCGITNLYLKPASYSQI